MIVCMTCIDDEVWFALLYAHVCREGRRNSADVIYTKLSALTVGCHSYLGTVMHTLIAWLALPRQERVT
jgi:hypothetical protein